VSTLIGRMFHVSYSLKGVALLLHRMGWTPQVPIHRAAERDDDAVATWRKTTWPQVKRIARRLGAWICFADEAGQTLRPARARTWAPRGHTPVVAVTGTGSGRTSIAALACYKAGEKSRLIYRMMLHRGRKGEKKGFREHDFAALLDAAHQQLGGPIVLV
jgi:winged helix-turn-helix protein